MLLSQENVLYHNEKDKDHFTRYDRVKEFVDDQVKQHYQSQRMNPNNEGKDSVSAYPTTASITSSKAHTPTAAPLVKARENKSTNGNMLHASSHLQLSKSKKFGLHLLEKFTSPNLVIDRVTHKQRLNRPSIGIFNKGKSSAKGKIKQGVEDLLFSENDFLHPRDQNGISPASSDTGPSESPYFQQKERNSRLQVEPLPLPLPLSSSPSLSLVQKTKPKKIQHVKESSKMMNINKSTAYNTSQFTNRDYDPHYQEEKVVTPIKRRKLVTNPSPPSIISRISVLKQSNGHHEKPRNSNRAQRTNGNESDHSNDSIKRLLSECKEAPQPENTKTNNNNSASDYIWRPSLSSLSNISPAQRVYSSPENYLPSRYNESTSSYRSSYTDRLLSVDHKLYQIDDYNSDELSPLRTLYEEEDNGIKNFWRNQYKRRL